MLSRPTADSLNYQTAGQLLRALKTRQISALELINSTIARVQALDDAINAIVEYDFDQARANAKTADEALERGSEQPLLGLPMTVKEQFNVAGLTTTWGNPAFKGWKPEFESVAVMRLKAAGAVIFGKSNVPFMMGDCQTYNEIYGVTSNPWDHSLTPGGSSGGSAASIAAGYVSLELASDLAGSLRLPASFCGVYSHKPSINLIPLRGALMPGSPPSWPYAFSLTTGDWAVAGPMARSAADLDLGLDVLAGPDEMAERAGYRLALRDARHRTLAGYRILLLDRHPLCPTHPAIASAIETLAARLVSSGCQVSRASLELPDLALTGETFTQLLQANLSANLLEADMEAVRSAARSLDADDHGLNALRLRAMLFDYRSWKRVSSAAAELVQQWRSLFSSFDLILCPATATPAFAHDHQSVQATRTLEIGGERVLTVDAGIWASIASLAGLPATVAPIGLTDQGLPLAVQIIGPYLEDRSTIAFARLMEREYGGFIPPLQNLRSEPQNFCPIEPKHPNLVS